MSLRGSKRASSRSEDAAGCKRRKTDSDDSQWQARPLNDLKISTIYNRSAPEAPAELFRKDLISAMKLPDSEPLTPGEYWVITDPWKQEWERGVQVPVNPDSLPEPTVTEIPQSASHSREEFKLPKTKYIRLTRDNNFNANEHHLSTAMAEATCAYDMDACDAAWLRALNGERAKAGVQPLHEEQLERVIEELEVRCWNKIQAIMKSEEGLGIEYDENVICDVCRSPDSEEGNEMVFCDSCNICVHQACYGITTIPSGQWICSPCNEGINPVCVLCPNFGGAMKSTPSGHKWAHVSCVLWIPEVSIGCAEKMEPITKISSIPPSRWSLICVLCRERTGACIQCSVKTCKTAYHVTCAFKHGLEMRAIIEDDGADDGVKLRSYCQRHSVNSKKDKNNGSSSEEEESRRKRRKDMTSEEKSQARAIRLHEIEAEFDRHVSIKDISAHLLDVDQDGIQYMYNYWKLKRKAGHNRPLLPPKTDESDILIHRQEQADIDKKKMFVQLRQDLERVRNLCYMVSRREKLSRSYFRMREQTFHKQVAVLSEEQNLQSSVMNAVIEANHGPSIYDRLYSHPGAIDHKNDFDAILAQIAGIDSEDETKKDLNGLIRRTKPVEHSYKRLCNGARTSTSLADYSGFSSAESAPDREPHPQNKYRRPIYSSTDEEESPSVTHTKKKGTSKEKDNMDNKTIEKKKSRSLRGKLDTSSEEDVKSPSKKSNWHSQSTLRQMEREMGARPLSGTESDDLIPMRPVKKFTENIYSDSECSDGIKNEDVNEDKSSNATSDSQQQPFRTKAAVKEFIPIPKGVSRNVDQSKKQKSDEEGKNKDSVKSSKNKDYPSDLIVPQRQAAKKASENMRSNTATIKNKEVTDSTDVKVSQPIEDGKGKIKQKCKEKKKEIKEQTSKEIFLKKESKLSSDLFDFEKESEKDNQDILAYVPQRQAAKKAAEHIKSGMSKVPEGSIEDNNKKKEIVIETPKKSPRKEEKRRRSSSSSSASSFTSTHSYTSTSYDEEQRDKDASIELSTMTKYSKIRYPKKSLLPFLDKGPETDPSSNLFSDSESHKETHSTKESYSNKEPHSSKDSHVNKETHSNRECHSNRESYSNKDSHSNRESFSNKESHFIKDSHSNKESNSNKEFNYSKGYNKEHHFSKESYSNKESHTSKESHSNKEFHYNRQSPSRSSQKKSILPATTQITKSSGVSKKVAEKKYKSSESSAGIVSNTATVEREKLSRTGNASTRTSTRTRTRSITSGSGNLLDGKDSKQGKSNVKEEHISTSKDSKEDPESSKLSSSQWKTDKKLKHSKFLAADCKLENDSDYSKKFTKFDDCNMSTKSSVSESPTDTKTNRNKNNSEEKSMSKTYHLSHIEDKPKVTESLPIIDSKYDSPDTKKHSEIIDKATGFDKNLRKSSNKIFKSNNIVKSPKTPLQTDHKLTEPCEGQTPKLHESKDKKPKLVLTDIVEKVVDTYSTECSELQEIDSHKTKPPIPPTGYPNRSIFSPPAGKDTGCSELFDFENDMLAVDETAHDDSFSLSQGNEEIMKPASLSFTFSADFLFKEDSKEDRGVRETLNLVEKLRMNLKMDSKKTDTLSGPNEVDKFVTEVKDADKSLPSLNDPPYKPELPEEPKEFVKNDVIQNTKPCDKVASPPILSVPDNIYDAPYKTDSVQNNVPIKEPENCNIKEKTWLNTRNDITSQNSFGIENEKLSQYNKNSDYVDTVKNNPMILQNEILDKIQPVEMMNKESFLTEQSTEKTFEPHLESASNADMNHSEIVANNQNKALSMSLKALPNFDNDNLHQPDCTPISSPYSNIKQQRKWSENALIPARRSSTSSSTSDTSSVSHKQEDTDNNKPDGNIQSQVHNAMLQNIEYPAMPQYHHPFSADSIHYSQFSSEASQFVGGPVALFPSATLNSKLPLSTSVTPILHSNFPVSYENSNTIMNQMSKINEEPAPFQVPCSAAFTSSSHNMALTTAMVTPLTPKPINEHSTNNEGESELPPHHFAMHNSPLPTIEEFSNAPLLQSQGPVDKQTTSAAIVSPIQDKKSPSKPTRTSSRFVPHPTKSPGKSPGKSPKQLDNIKGGVNRRGISRNSRGSRGRGRPRGKTIQNIHNFSHLDMEFGICNTIHNKLVGTVYDLDFDEDISNNSVSDLKSMRERRRSTDIHDKKSDNSYRDSSQSPKFTSPSQHANKRFAADIKELRPPTPITELPTAIETPTSPATLPSSIETVQPFTNIVQPVLPGPVDMRTYSRFEPSNTDAFNNHILSGFENETADHQPTEIDEEMEKELHTYLMNSNESQEIVEPVNVPVKNEERVNEEPAQCYDLSTPKVSLTDSRNQLKVKIKGPFLDANYSTSCIAPVIPQVPVIEQSTGMQVLGTPSAVGSVTPAMLSGTSNLRRMRKKELLRQYCTQDMNMSDPVPGTSNNQDTTPVSVTPFSRNIITIPKAVASMTSIPTREDYKAVVDANMEKKRRKMTGVRELRHLDQSQNDLDSLSLHNINKSSTPSQLALSYKRRGRAPKPLPVVTSDINMPSAPKLRIKIRGCLSSEQSNNDDPNLGFQFRPPKKRLTSIPRPTVKDLRRESMKFRRKVMADFEEGEKEKKKRIKTEKRKKKKEKWGSEMHIVNKKVEDSTKLIIRISRKKDDNSSGSNANYSEGNSGTQNAEQPAVYDQNQPAPTEDPFDYDPTAPDPLALDSPAPTEASTSGIGKLRTSKVSPIRLKLSRDGGGSSYVMKDSPGPPTEESSNVSLMEPINPDPLNCQSIPHNKHCEVR